MILKNRLRVLLQYKADVINNTVPVVVREKGNGMEILNIFIN